MIGMANKAFAAKRKKPRPLKSDVTISSANLSLLAFLKSKDYDK